MKRKFFFLITSILLISVLFTSCNETDINSFEYDFIDDGCARILSYNGSDRNVIIPEKIEDRDVTVIYNYAFGSELSGDMMANENYTYTPASDLISIKFPSKLLSVCEGGFRFCNCLESIDFSECKYFNYVGKYAFANCNSLISIKLSGSTQGILDYAFSYCPKLNSIVIPKNVSIISQYAFYSCDTLSDVYFEKEFNGQIFEDVFDNCSPSLVLHGEPGSSVEEYADKNGLTFKSI